MIFVKYLDGVGDIFWRVDSPRDLRQPVEVVSRDTTEIRRVVFSLEATNRYAMSR
jgi:hypothetical protein